MSKGFSNLIDGDWVSSADHLADISPADTSDVIGEFPRSTTADVLAAIGAARCAFPAWRDFPAQQRTDILFKAASSIRNEAARLGRLLSREQGRPLPEAIGEVIRAAQIFEFFAGEVVRTGGEIFPSTRPGAEAYILREPLGVVGMITPWNVPMAIPAWKIAPALAYGNTVVIKPAELVPACTWELCRILVDAGLPKGVLNLVMGSGRILGEPLLQSPDVDAISFTGSVATGNHIAVQAVQTHKKVQCEMGGKNPLVILDDADLAIAVECAIDGAFFWTGQRCTASSRLIVTMGIHDRFVERMLARMAEIKVGHPLKEGTQIGPVVDERQFAQNQRYVKVARDNGGEVHGGGPLERETKGFYMAPALVLNTTNTMQINREEVFGPLACVIKVSDYDEALAVANDTDFGLSSGICTQSLRHSSHFRRYARTGVVAVNMTTTGSEYHVAFGGRRASSYGAREQGRYAMDFYTAIKTCYVRA